MGLSIALACVSAVCGFLLVYPYLIYPLVLRKLPQKPVHGEPCDLSVSILFCAYNERGSIEAKIENLRALKARHPMLQILAYDDGSDDGTYELLARETDLISLVRGSGRSGKATGMKKLARRATGQILVFTDANVICHPEAIDRLLPYYGDPEIGGVCGLLRYESSSMTPTAEIGLQYWNLDEDLRGLESGTGNVIGADGSLFSIRRELYPQFPDTVLDDFVVSMSVIFAGKRLIRASDVVAFEESVALSDEEFRRKIRIGTRAYHTHAWMRDRLRRMPVMDQFKYFSRKFLRWYGGSFLVLSAVTGLAAIALVSWQAFLVAGLVGLASMALILSARTGPLAKAGEIVRALIGTQIGILRGMRGRTIATWDPAVSR